jgi:hypothetical protein
MHQQIRIDVESQVTGNRISYIDGCKPGIFERRLKICVGSLLNIQNEIGVQEDSGRHSSFGMDVVALRSRQ